MRSQNSALFLDERINLWRTAGSPLCSKPLESSLKCLAELRILLVDETTLRERLALEDLTVDDLLSALSWRGSALEQAEETIITRYNTYFVRPLALTQSFDEYLNLEKKYQIPFLALFAPSIQSELEKQAKFLTLSKSLKTSCLVTVARLVSDRLSRVPLVVLRRFRETNSESSYEDFLKCFASSALPIARTFPVFARLLTDSILTQVRNLLFLLEKFDTDRGEIETLGLIDAEDELIELESGLSDPHESSMSVAILKFNSGKKIVFKPKNLDLEFWAYNTFQPLLSEHASNSIGFPKILSRPKYSWMEFILNQNDFDSAEIGCLLSNFGTLLALAHVFNITDLHSENLILSNAKPFLIDLETILTPGSANDLADSEETLLSQSIQLSCLRTLLIPNPMYIEELEITIDMSAFAGRHTQQASLSTMKWSKVGTINMEGIAERQQYTGGGVDLGCSAKSVLDHLPILLRSFNDTYQHLKQHTAMIIESQQNLPSKAKVRTVMRNTRVFEWLLFRATEPSNLVDGAIFSSQFELLNRGADFSDERVIQRMKICKAEKSALHSLNIPKAELHVDDQEVFINGVATGFFAFESPSQGLTRKLSLLSDVDRATQNKIILAAFAADSTGRPLMECSSKTIPSKSKIISIQSQADVICKTIVKNLINTSELSETGAQWLTTASVTPNVAQYCCTDITLYSGITGIALFLASLTPSLQTAVTDDILTKCILSLHSTLNRMNENHSQFKPRLSAGEYGQILWALMKIYELTQRSSVMDLVHSIIPLLRQSYSQSPMSSDLLSGNAGALIGMMAVCDHLNDIHYHQLTNDLENSLLENRVLMESGIHGWTAKNGRFMSGFSHGQSGIAFALLQRYARTCDTKLISVVEEAILLENSTFDYHACNWVDHRSAVQNSEAWSWCHGGPGISLTRCLYKELTNNDQFDDDIQVFIEKFAHWTPNSFTVCCGAAGIIECAEVVRETTHDTTMSQIINEKLDCLWKFFNQAEKAMPIFPNIPPSQFIPSLFQGWSGVGMVFRNFSQELAPVRLVTFGQSIKGLRIREDERKSA